MRNLHNPITKFYYFSRIILILILLFTIFPQKALAATFPYLITSGVPARPPTTVGETFFQKDIIINYTSGNIILSRNSDGSGNTWADDAINITVTRDNSSPLSFTHSYQTNCTQLDSFPPKDITHLFGVGANRVHVALYDICGFSIASDPIHLVNTNAPGPSPTPTPTPTPTSPPTPTPPQPFLDLPWDYEEKGMDFNEAAMSINTFFDHTYPLLSSGLIEPKDFLNQITTYKNEISTRLSYSRHDGYDYGNPAEVEFEDNVLAAASGIATFVNTCGACGNAIHIDHENGFQTRYYHLDHKGLITHTPNQPVSVNSGQIIGKVGFTGNVSPAGEVGAHIHFMVIEDKNKDGNFEDNIPDGLVDPFGWQSIDQDPWENYSFIYNSKQKTGNKSYYLWNKKLDALDATIPANGVIFKTGKYLVELPANTVAVGSTIEMKAAPAAKSSDNLESVGSVMDIILKDPLGSLITILTNPMLVVIDFTQADISRYKIGSLSIYSSTDRENWVKEESLINFLNNKASAQVDHLTYFALMGERLDTIAPTTSADLQGEKGQLNWFRSETQLIFNSIDNDGGLGVKYTAYKLESGDWQKYSDPLMFTTEGHHKIEYYSEDNDGNIEDINSIEFDIDKTPPALSASADRTPDTNDWYNHPVTISFTGQDYDSGIDNCTESIIYKEPDNENAIVEGYCTDKAGNIGSTSFNFKYDSKPPTLSAVAFTKGLPYASGSWTNADVQVKFNCTDNTSGVKIVSEPIIVKTEGKNQSVKSICEDNAGNKSELNFNGINIDKTSPEAQIGYDLSSFDSIVTGKDNLGSTTFTVDKTQPLRPKYTIADQAGNKLLLTIGKVKIDKQVALNVNSLQYNSNPSLSLDPNVFFTLALTDKTNKIKQLDQYYSLKDDKKIFTLYSSSSNTTKIYTKSPGTTTYTSEIKPGIILLQLFTQQGSLKYKY